jgi:hypothetical protein
MFDPKTFYSHFQINYFDYKLAYLTYALKNHKTFNQDKIILDYSDKDFLISIKSDIRQTLFQAIETVFEIFYALHPNKDGYIIDKEIMRTLSKAEFHYSKITEIAEDIAKLNYLKNEIKLSDGTLVPLGEYIFYFGTYTIDRLKSKKQESLVAIQTSLHLLANEFSDRKEYNCYKHGLRIIPAISNFKIMNAEDQSKSFTWDLNDSMTYYTEEDKINKMEFVTKIFDNERDIKLIRICSDLLWNIIKLRDIAFNKAGNVDGKLNIFLFDKDLVKEAYKMNVPFQNLRLTTSIEETT